MINKEYKIKHSKIPFRHWIIDNFFDIEIAKNLEDTFPEYESPKWHFYKNAIEDKKTLNSYDAFKPILYRAIHYLNSDEFIGKIKDMTGEKELYADWGLNGGGLHMHGNGGNLNPHLDYSVHPKMEMQRAYNILIYLSQNLDPDIDGGHLGLYSSNGSEPNLDDVYEIAPIFNRAVIFDVTGQTWHGLNRSFTPRNGIYRKSLAIYYLKDIDESADMNRRKAYFYPRKNQKSDKNIKDLIKKRASVEGAETVYRA